MDLQQLIESLVTLKTAHNLSQECMDQLLQNIPSWFSCKEFVRVNSHHKLMWELNNLVNMKQTLVFCTTKTYTRKELQQKAAVAGEN